MSRVPALRASLRPWLRGVLLGLCVQAAWRCPARAQVAPRVELEAGVTCLERALFLERLSAWLADVAIPVELAVEVRGSAIDPRSVEVFVRRSDGEMAQREFGPGPERCADLHDAVALAAALLVRALATDAASSTPPATTAPAAPPAAPPPPSLPAPAPPPSEPTFPTPDPPPPPARIRPVPAPARPAPAWIRELTLGASGLLALDLGTGRSAGARVYTGFRALRSLDLRLGAQGLRGNSEPLPNSGGRYATRIDAASVEACLRAPESPALTVRLCAGFAAGVLRARGAAYARDLDARVRWLAASLGPELGFPISAAWSVSLATTLVVALERSEVAAFNAHGEVVASAALPRWGGLFALGLAYRFFLGNEQNARRAQGSGPSLHE